MTHAIIFDMDGTLFQTDKILARALDDAFNHLRLQGKWDGLTPIAKYREIMGLPLPQVWATLLPNHSTEERAQIDAYFLARLIEHIGEGNGDLYPKVKEILRYLKDQGYSIFIASNGLVEYLKAIVSYYDLDRWVTETFSIQQIESLNKSDLVGSIIDQYRITNGAVVGDRLSDIQAAKDHGLVAIGCNFDFAQEKELAQADFVIDHLVELQKILPRLNKPLQS